MQFFSWNMDRQGESVGEEQKAFKKGNKNWGDSWNLFPRGRQSRKKIKLLIILYNLRFSVQKYKVIA